MRIRRRQTEVFNLSFLDVISCGFGAIILLLVISKISEPRVIEQTNVDLSGLVVQLEEELHEIRGETQILNRQLIARQEQLSEHKEKLARLQGALTNIEGQYHLASTASEAQSLIQDELKSAKQELSAEMRQLLTNYQRPREDAVIGGIPVDSEYIIFVIDTSGSMQRFAWPLVRKKMKEILDIYPQSEGGAGTQRYGRLHVLSICRQLDPRFNSPSSRYSRPALFLGTFFQFQPRRRDYQGDSTLLRL